MGAFILVILFSTPNGASTAMAEFSSKQMCESAADQVNKRERTFSIVTAFCVEK